MAKKQTTKPANSDTQSGDDDNVVQMVIKDFNKAWDYTNNSWHSRWEDNYKLYNNERIKYGYMGISDTFVPMTFSTVETLVSALFGTKPKFDFIPPNEEDTDNTDILNGLMDSYWDKDQWSEKVINTGRGFIREGTAVDYFMWDINHPRLINVPIRDFFIDPNAFELDESSTRFCGRRYLTTLDELQSFEVVDLEGEPDKDGNPPMKKKYKNLDKLKGKSADEPVEGVGASPGDQRTDKQEKDMFYGSTLSEPDKDQIEVIEYWTVDKTISIANRMYDIENVENYFKTQDKANGNPFPQGILPFADARNYKDASLFYAKGDVDFISDQQEDLNDFSNQEKDAVSFNLNQMKTLDPKYAHLLPEIENLPGAIIPVEAAAFQPVQNGVIPPEAFNERQNIKAEIRETTASNEVIKGAPQSGTGQQTATEVNAQIAGAGQRISLKVTQLENGYFHRMAKIVFRMIQLYVTEPQMVRILGKDGARWEQFDPSKFKSMYEPRVQLDITVQGKKQQLATDAANMLKAFLGDPNVNQQELTKIVLQRSFDLDPDEVQKLMVDQQSAGAMPGMPQVDPTTGQPMTAGTSPVPAGPSPKLPSESITFKDAVAAGAIDSAAAMLNQAGLPSDDIQQQRPAPGQVVGGQVQQPQPTDPNATPGQPDQSGQPQIDTDQIAELLNSHGPAGPSATDLVPHPVTSQPVMAGEV